MKLLDTLFVLLHFGAAAFAYQVTLPLARTVWTSTGPNVLAWNRVVTDSRNFTAVLVNQDRSVLPVNNYLLVSFVDGTKGSVQISPPQGRFPVGSGFQVNLVKSQAEVDTIYAQSQQFTIVAGTGAGAVGGGSSPTVTSGPPAVAPTGTIAQDPVGRSTLVVTNTADDSEATEDAVALNSARVMHMPPLPLMVALAYALVSIL